MLQVKLEKPTPENSCLIKLTQGKFAIVDRQFASLAWEYKWRAVRWHYRWYAYSTCESCGTHCRVAMHRLIANTPAGQVCHHYNRNSLDNRRANLLNQTNRQHAELHRIRRWGRQNKLSRAKSRPASGVKTSEKRQ